MSHEWRIASTISTLQHKNSHRPVRWLFWHLHLRKVKPVTCVDPRRKNCKYNQYFALYKLSSTRPMVVSASAMLLRSTEKCYDNVTMLVARSGNNVQNVCSQFCSRSTHVLETMRKGESASKLKSFGIASKGILGHC